MRICLIARNRFHRDRKGLVKYNSLVRAGHHVDVVAVDAEGPRHPVSVTVPPRAGPDNRVGSLARRLLPRAARQGLLRHRLTEACVEVQAEVYIPLHADTLNIAIEAARKTGAVVQRTPDMDDAGDFDLIRLAPSHPNKAMPTSGAGRAFVPGQAPEPYTPQPGRHDGGAAVICYRKTAANPGRYLESALIRSGMEVRVETDSIDLDTVDPNTRFVLFVESPYPAIEVTGSTGVPTLFWAHHGEHHLHANIRLCDRYAADAVLLAHSWHLAHWFQAPVHRFPFAVAPELQGRTKPLVDRRFDVAMVGSKLRSDAWQYQRRRQLVEQLESRWDRERLCFVEGVTPEEMSDIYGESRIVLNEGGVRHYPVTMRVFEAVGSNAALLTDPVPGLEMLFESNEEYAVLTSDVVEDVTKLLGDLDATQAMALRASDHAREHHTYDHRVDQLVAIVSDLPKRVSTSPTATSELARLIDRDVEVQRVLHADAHHLEAELPDREIWPMEERLGRMTPRSMDAVVITSGDADEMSDLLDTARRYIYAGEQVSGLEDYLAERRPSSTLAKYGSYRRVDLKAEAYRVGPERSSQ